MEVNESSLPEPEQPIEVRQCERDGCDRTFYLKRVDKKFCSAICRTWDWHHRKDKERRVYRKRSY